MQKKIVIVGSFMMDMVTNAPEFPKKGQTVVGYSLERHPGGKGANQAVAISRLGKEACFVGMVGDDEFGHIAKSTLKENGLDVSGLIVKEGETTGVGCVWVNQDGDNSIIVVPGANLKYSMKDFDQLGNILEETDLVVLQLEMDLSFTKALIARCKKSGVPVLLNPAPAVHLEKDVLSGLTYITPNETELSILTNQTVKTTNDAINAARDLVRSGVKNVIATLGEKGAIWVNEKGDVFEESGNKVVAVDTVAAGDSFNGALACGIIDGLTETEILRLANSVGALTVTKRGAIPSLPTYSEVKDFNKNNPVT